MRWVGCVSFLRKVGLLPSRKHPVEQVNRAELENVARDNEESLKKVHEAYAKAQESNGELRKSLQNFAPFRDFEKFMHGGKNREVKH